MWYFGKLKQGDQVFTIEADIPINVVYDTSYKIQYSLLQGFNGRKVNLPSELIGDCDQGMVTGECHISELHDLEAATAKHRPSWVSQRI